MGTEMRNPFVLGIPVRPPEFYGRSEELHRLTEGIASGQSFLVYGDRRIGKTSLLFALRHHLAERDHIDPAVIVDAQALQGTDELIYQIVRGIEAATGASPKMREITEGEGPFRALRRAIKLSGPRRVVLLLDEAEALFFRAHPDDGFRAAAAMRSLISEGLLVLVATAFSPASIRSEDDTMVSPLYNVLIHLHLGGFTRDETIGFLRSRFHGLGITTEVPFEHRLIELSGGYPFLVQMLCYHAYERIRSASGPKKLTDALLDNLDSLQIEHLIGPQLGRMQPEQILILTTLAEIEQPASLEEIHARLSAQREVVPHPVRGIIDEPDQLMKSLSQLQMSYLVRRDGSRYGIAHGLLRLYIQRYTAQFTAELWGEPDLRGRLSKDTVIRGDWANIELELSANTPFAVDIVKVSASAEGGVEIESLESHYPRFQGRGSVRLRVRCPEVGSSTLQIEVKYAVVGKEYLAVIRHDIEFVVSADEFVTLRSPYVFGVPVTDPALFRGREGIVSRVVEALRPPSGIEKRDIALVGRRRIGKTSILLKLREQARGHGFVPAFVNLEKVEPRTMGVLHAHLIEALAEALLEGGKGGWWLRSRLALFRWRRQMRAMRLSVRGGPMELKQADPLEIRTFELDLRRILHFRRRFYPDAAYMAVLIDEATLLAAFESKHTLSYLRGIIQSEDLREINWIIAGSDLLYTLTSRESSPLYNLFLTLRVRALDSTTTAELIRSPIEGQGVEYSSDAVDYITDVTGGIPYWVQAVCHHVVDLLNERRKLDVQLRDARDAVRRVVQHQDLSLLEIWNELSAVERFLFCLVAGEDGRPRASRLIALSSDLKVPLNETRVLESMARLESVGIVAEEDGLFTIEDGILREWVRSKKRARDLADAAQEALRTAEQRAGADAEDRAAQP